MSLIPRNLPAQVFSTNTAYTALFGGNLENRDNTSWNATPYSSLLICLHTAGVFSGRGAMWHFTLTDEWLSQIPMSRFTARRLPGMILAGRRRSPPCAMWRVSRGANVGQSLCGCCGGMRYGLSASGLHGPSSRSGHLPGRSCVHAPAEITARLVGPAFVGDVVGELSRRLPSGMDRPAGLCCRDASAVSAGFRATEPALLAGHDLRSCCVRASPERVWGGLSGFCVPPESDDGEPGRVATNQVTGRAYGFDILLYAAALVLVLSWRTVRPADRILFAFFASASLTAFRNTPFIGFRRRFSLPRNFRSPW